MLFSGINPDFSQAQPQEPQSLRGPIEKTKTLTTDISDVPSNGFPGRKLQACVVLSDWQFMEKSGVPNAEMATKKAQHILLQQNH